MPVGLKDAKKLLEDIPNKVRDILGIMVDVNLREEADKELLEIRVEPYPSPISYKGEYPYRSGGTKQELKGAALSRFLLKKQGLHWDGVPAPFDGSSPGTRPVAARKVALAGRRVLEAGRPVLLFHPDPERFVTGAYVKIGFFENNVDLRY